jgi:AcrR family transcriptional regulator
MASKDRPGRSKAKPKATNSSGKSGPQAEESLRDFVVDQVAEKIADKIERSTINAAKRAEQMAHRSDRAARKAALKAETLDRLAAHLGALDVWTRVEPAARRPRFTREEIAEAAIRIADNEGFDAVSMRRIAAELDAGTMTLYHYIRTKDELLTLVTDAVMAEVVLGPDEKMPEHWRDAMTLLAERSRAALQSHPWILDLIDDPAIGPNSVRHFDQTIQAVASLPISLRDKLDIAAVVDEYVFGYCLQERNNVHVNDPGTDTHMVSYVQSLLATGDYPHLRALADEMGLEQAWHEIEAHMRDEARFARNLNRLLDGIEAGLGSSSPA